MAKVASFRRFPYPGWSVDVYEGEEEVLVVLRDLGGPREAIGLAAREVRARVLGPLGLGKPVRWAHWSREDGVLSQVAFQDPEGLQGPRWGPFPPRAFRWLIGEMGGREDLEAWLRAGEFSLAR